MIFAIIVVLFLLVAPIMGTEVVAAAAERVYTIQVGAFVDRVPAMQEMTALRRQGLAPFMLDIYDSKHNMWHTVHIGKYTDAVQAKSERGRFTQKTGKRAIVFAHTPESIALFASRVSTKGTQPQHAPIPVVATAEEGAVAVSQQSETTPQQDGATSERVVSTPNQAEATPGATPESTPEVPGKFYGMISAGVSHNGKSASDLDRDLGGSGYPTTSQVDRTNPSGKLVGGYRFTENFAVEAGYVHFQGVDTQVNTTKDQAGLIDQLAKHAPLTVRGGSVVGVASWQPLPAVSLLGKAGGFLWKGKVNANNGQNETVSREENGLDPVVGAGAEIHMWDRKSLRLECERFLTPDRIDLVSVGFKVGF